MKNIRYGSIFLLIATMLVTSCANNTTQTVTDTCANETTAESGTTEQTSPYESDNLPELDYSGADFTIFVEDYGGYCAVDYYNDSMNGDVVNDAIYSRNQAVSDRLNINLKWDKFTHDWDDRQKYFDMFRSEIMSASGTWDVVSASGYFMPSMTDLLQEMTNLPYIDIDKPWWSDKYMRNSMINGKYYYVTGDASLGLLKNMYCIFENVNLYNSLGLSDNTYQLVYDGKWTLDKLAELSASAYNDLNGDGQKDENDRLGILIKQNNMWTGFLESLDVEIANLDGNTVNFTFGNEHTVDVVEKLQAFKNNTGVLYYEKGHSETMNDSPFINGNSLFTTGWLMHADTYRNSTFVYTILPYPKWDEDSDYSTTVLTTYFVHSLPNDCPDTDRAAAVLEAFASESYRTVTPSYFEVALKTKYAADADTSKMFDIIRDGIDFNFGYIYTFIADGISDQFKSAIIDNKNWASTITRQQNKAVTKFDMLISEINSIKA